VGEPTPVPGDGQSDFVSELGASGGVSSGDNLGGGGGAAGASGIDTAAPQEDDGDDGDAERAISEADILQLSGDRLYALSRYNGLTVIDVSDPAGLRLEGSYRIAAEPFEMYVEDGIVFAMFNSWYSYECGAGSYCSWQSSSRLQALDARDPQTIALIGEKVVPGSISDSRRVGDILYLATEEWRSCWGCGTAASTKLTSFDVSEPGSFAQIDQLSLPGDHYGGPRSIAVTNQRIYVAGPDYDLNHGAVPSTVRVVDISDPSGALVSGASFAVAGMIQSRWQMDEHEGVFRVVSQPGGWGTAEPPVVQTFDVNSLSDVVPLGSLAIQLPRPDEVLQSVRFDGTRAYAITAEQQDPLFTFDLSEPATPRQVGELEMPGWVYHMEPRGNRVFALGYDPANPEGMLHVSLFDVTDLAQPALLSRVAFGGDWARFAEGQDQIHKAFSILAEQGLILVPFSGNSYDADSCAYEYQSGIQLVDFTEQSLARRGVAPQRGTARRAFMHRDRLFGVGDNTVQAFDISDRDNPVQSGALEVARNVSTVHVIGDHLMRFGNEWTTNQTIVDMTPLERASDAQPDAEIDLSALLGEDAWSCGQLSHWGGQVFTHGDYAYVPRYSYDYDYGRSETETRLTFYIVDISNRAAPVAVGSLGTEPVRLGWSLTDIVQTNNALLVGREKEPVYGNGERIDGAHNYYDVIDLSDPRAPRTATRFEVPEQIAGGGWGHFDVGCTLDMGWGWYGGGYTVGDGRMTLSDGDLVVSQHSEPVPGSDTRVRYYLDRIDVSDPNQPTMLPKINIPGKAIHFNAATSELVTIDTEYTLETAANRDDCAVRGRYGRSAYTPQNPDGCQVARRSISSLSISGDRAVRKSQLSLDVTRRTQSIAVSGSRIFYTTTEFPSALAVTVTPVTLETLQLEAGELVQLPSEQLRQQTNPVYQNRNGFGELLARGDRAFEIYDNTVTVVDTAQATAYERLEHELPSWGCQSLEVAADRAFCAVGYRGVEVIDLTQLR